MEIINKNKLQTFWLLISVVLLQACTSSEPISNEFYVLGASSKSSATMVSGEPKLSIRRVKLPQYLEKDGVARDIGDGKIQVSFQNLWGQKLSDAIPTYLASEIESELKQPVIQHPLPAGFKVDVILEVDVSKFIAHNTHLILETKYRLIKPKSLMVYNFMTTVKLDDNSVRSAVNAHEIALQRLATDIANNVR